MGGTALHNNPLPNIPLQHTMNSSRQILSRTDRQSFEAFRHPAFVQAVNRAANLKCIEAIKSGKLRVVAPHPTSSPSEYTPRYVFFEYILLRSLSLTFFPAWIL